MFFLERATHMAKPAGYFFAKESYFESLIEKLSETGCEHIYTHQVQTEKWCHYMLSRFTALYFRVSGKAVLLSCQFHEKQKSDYSYEKPYWSVGFEIHFEKSRILHKPFTEPDGSITQSCHEWLNQKRDCISFADFEDYGGSVDYNLAQISKHWEQKKGPRLQCKIFAEHVATLLEQLSPFITESFSSRPLVYYPMVHQAPEQEETFWKKFPKERLQYKKNHRP